MPWNLELQILMEEVWFWEHVEKHISSATNMKKLDTHNKKHAKEKRIILDLVKDHFIPHIVENKNGKEMFELLVGLFENSCVSKQMLLHNKLSVTCMRKINTWVSYLTKITKFIDQLVAIGTMLEDEDFGSLL